MDWSFLIRNKTAITVSTDTRNLPAGCVFFALKGARFNGNLFAVQALETGASYAVVDEDIPQTCSMKRSYDGRLIRVDNSLIALQELAREWRRQWAAMPPSDGSLKRKTVVAITGTNGKTTTKELTAAVLSTRYHVHFTQGNLNNQVGVPLTLLQLRQEHDIAIVEMGASHPGDIRELVDIAEPDCGLITNVGRAHLEGFGSFEGVQRTKGELYDDLRRRGKQVFLNALDNDILQMALQRGFTLGRDALPYVEGRVSQVAPYLQIQWRADVDQPWHTVSTNLIGAYNISNLRAAVTVGLYFGISPEEIDEALAAYRPTNSRSELRRVGTNSLIVDAYNANPSSMAAALTNLSLVDDAHKMVILGDMRELGEGSLEEHCRVVRRLQEMNLERIWLVGEEFGKAAAEGMRVFSDVEAVKEALGEVMPRHATILIKGSNGTKLWQLPDAIAENWK